MVIRSYLVKHVILYSFLSAPHPLWFCTYIMSITHLVLFQFKSDVTPEVIKDVCFSRGITVIC